MDVLRKSNREAQWCVLNRGLYGMKTAFGRCLTAILSTITLGMNKMLLRR